MKIDLKSSVTLEINKFPEGDIDVYSIASLMGFQNVTPLVTEINDAMYMADSGNSKVVIFIKSYDLDKLTHEIPESYFKGVIVDVAEQEEYNEFNHRLNQLVWVY